MGFPELERLSEDQETIGRWAVQNFGSPNVLAILRRQCDELLETMELCVVNNEATRTMFKAMRMGLEHLDKYAHSREDQLRLASAIGQELADTHIVGYHAANVLGIDLQGFITEKMKVNRRRKWERNADGTGQHVDEDIVMRGVDEEE